MENNFNTGQIVFATANPEQILVVRRYLDRIYYCRMKDSENEKDLVYFERELEGFNG